MSPFAMEIIRQCLRWLAVYLVALGLPASIQPLFEHPEAAAVVAAAISYLLADTGWLVSKVRSWFRGRA